MYRGEDGVYRLAFRVANLRQHQVGGWTCSSTACVLLLSTGNLSNQSDQSRFGLSMPVG
jgi:hypothetical protein